jgi:predicted transposase YbfD/YdcC
VRALRRTERGAELIAIDGKAARRSFDSSKGKSAIHMVSAWANKNRLVLAQVKVGTQKKIAQRIREGKAEYVLALKANQGTLLENVKLYLDDALARSFRDVPYDSHTTVEKDHDRFEEREYWVSSELSRLPEAKGWKDMQSIGIVRATRQIKGESQTETR